MTAIERRDLCLPYRADEALMEEHKRCQRILNKLNHADLADFEEIRRIVKMLLGKTGDEEAFISPPFFCDYGCHIEVGKRFYANYNCTILDVAKVKIGDNCLLAPNVAIYAVGHPLHPVTRATGYEYGAPVTIGDNVWIGGSSVVVPGVTIGSNVVIGAGSVVTKDIPDWTLAAGNPCRVLRRITEKDQYFYFRDNRFDEEAWEDMQGLAEIGPLDGSV
ncbi:MAG: sugar O-acetyltransferase [Lachnospiraceae bacterium]|nr:sugar O-acetyltransferase [Lachnospiraceae bacterium]